MIVILIRSWWFLGGFWGDFGRSWGCLWEQPKYLEVSLDKYCQVVFTLNKLQKEQGRTRKHTNMQKAFSLYFYFRALKKQ